MSFNFITVTIAQDGQHDIHPAIDMAAAGKIFKLMRNQTLDDLNTKAILVIARPHHAIHATDITSQGVESLSGKLPRGIDFVGIMDRGAQLRLSCDKPFFTTTYLTHHFDGRVEGLSQPGKGDPLPGPLPPVNPAESLAEGTLSRRIMEWYQSGDTGVSSETMCFATLGGSKPRHTGFPSDPSDLGRCIRFLEKFPEARSKLADLRWMNGEATLAHEIRSSRGVHERTDDDVWGALIDHWDELTALYLEELPQGRAPKCYARMKELIQSVESPVKSPASPAPRC